MAAASVAAVSQSIRFATSPASGVAQSRRGSGCAGGISRRRIGDDAAACNSACGRTVRLVALRLVGREQPGAYIASVLVKGHLILFLLIILALPLYFTF
jgi:hypothetical protein